LPERSFAHHADRRVFAIGLPEGGFRYRRDGPCRIAVAGDRLSSAMAAEGFRGPKQLWNAFQWSMKGFRAAWRHEASFRLEASLVIVLVPIGLWLGQGGLEKFALILAPLLVLSAELLNSAIEAVVDKVSPEFHELAGRAKDMGSAAVFVLLIMVVLSWALILGPRLFG
jgi:diacylglycerol kinase (ATP)